MLFYSLRNEIRTSKRRLFPLLLLLFCCRRGDKKTATRVIEEKEKRRRGASTYYRNERKTESVYPRRRKKERKKKSSCYIASRKLTVPRDVPIDIFVIVVELSYSVWQKKLPTSVYRLIFVEGPHTRGALDRGPLSYATITISDDVTDEQRIEKAASDIRQVGERSGLRINVATVLNVDECRTNERGRHACRFETTVSLRNGSLDTREEPCPSSCEFRIFVNRPRRIGSRRPLYVAADICQN